MGTRNITKVVMNEQIVVCQYCQWDGYPTGQGFDVMEFVKEYCGGDKLKEFKKRLDNSCLMLAKAGKTCYTGAPVTNALRKIDQLRYEDHDHSDGWLKKYLEEGSVTQQEVREYMAASRDTGPDILTYLMESEPEGMVFYTDDYSYNMSLDLDWQIEGMFIINLDEEAVAISWHGKVRSYTFERVRGMTDKEIEDEMKDFEACEDEEEG